MNLNEDDIYNSIESYRNKAGYNQDKMAEIMGLESKQAYSNMIKNKTMKMIYFINLINKTGVSYQHFLDTISTKQPYKNEEKPQVLEDGCALCREKDKRIADKEEIIRGLNKTIDLLEFSLGKNLKASSE